MNSGSEALRRLADAAQPSASQVETSAVRIFENSFQRIVGHRVDGEVAPSQISDDVLQEDHLVGTTSVRVGPVAAKRRDLVRNAVSNHGDRSVLKTRGNRLREDTHQHIRTRRGAEVPIVRRPPEHRIAHASAHDPGAMPVLCERSGERTRRHRYIDRESVHGRAYGRSTALL
jgi:hypothetical protein